MTAIRSFSAALLVSSLALFATGCSPATQVVGTWKLDTTKALPADFMNANPLVGAFLAVSQPTIEAKFAGDGNFNLRAEGGPFKYAGKGSWRYVKSEGKTLILMIKESGKTDESELRFTPVDNEHAEIQIPLDFSKKPFSFVKVPPQS
ncbi:hypothetical protein [Anatilimnocola floriformis]|uniref:hypothetical protein n=1 Tax=Anatilimnocola floriformis TaxID=2948575 RepID=UPI0020C3B999|nr:hypothetical protein [Anatilimnocola floriformis]